MSYSIKVINKSGAAQNVAIYQTYPNLEGGMPLVWIKKGINNGNENTFEWDISWALNWGTSEQQLQEGVLWESGGTPQDVEPNTFGGKNAMGVSYSNEDFKNSEAYNDPKLQQGSMLVTTDTSFTVIESQKLSISIYMDDKPVFAMQGKPNGTYKFDTHPVYWLCVTDHRENVVISGTLVTAPTEATFANGITDLEFELTETLEFKSLN
jgi:hypothetical protein